MRLAERLPPLTTSSQRQRRMSQFLEWPQFDKPLVEEMANHHGLLAKSSEYSLMSHQGDLRRVLEDKQKLRDRNTARLFSEKLRILEKLRDRDRAIQSATVKTAGAKTAKKS